MAFLELESISKSYGRGRDRVEVLHGIDLEVEEGEFVAVLGFSGTGKTTLVSLIGGLIRPDEGKVRLEGKEVLNPGPHCGFVFQNYSLLPWLTARENIDLAVDHLFKDWPKAKRREHVERYLAMVNLSAAGEKHPRELSGGMRQRVSVARALAMNPKMLLLDEPLGALDAITRASLQSEISKIWSRDRKTVVLVTNDIDEAILLADRIVPLTPGPRATLGPIFPVPLCRPRMRAEFNEDPIYKRLRNDITKYFLSFRHSARNHEADLRLPDIRPMEMVA